MIWLLLCGAVVGLLLVLLTLGRYNETRILSDWRLMPSERDGAAPMGLYVMAEEAVLDSTRIMLRSRASTLEKMRLLALADDAITEAVPGRIERLQAMAKLCRMAAALQPIAPLSWFTFKLAGSRGVVGLGALAHHLLVSTSERFWLRLQVLGLVYHIARHAIGSAARKPPAASESARALFERAASDWMASDRELVVSLRLLLSSLASEPVAERVTVAR